MKEINIHNYILSEDSSLVDALKVINKNETYQIALIVNKKKKLIGTIVDGDIRRALLNNKNLDSKVIYSMNKNPITIENIKNINKIIKKIDQERLSIPVVDQLGRVKDLLVYDKNFGIKKDNIVFIPAGGEGKRLRPLTYKKPKPLIKIGKKSIIENIIGNLRKQGLVNFFIALNYKAELVKGELSKINGIQLNFIKEKKQLGTAGALKLINKLNDQPIVVINSDLFTDLDINLMLQYHKRNKSKLTVAVTKFKLDVPYGVVKIKNNHIQNINEKPSESFLINAGIYILEPDLIKFIKPNTKFDMTSLLNILIKKKIKISAFHLFEEWVDIGKISDLEKVKSMEKKL